jgi:NAD-dependent dihydropyrimidine dehydrogenase PreA subunit
MKRAVTNYFVDVVIGIAFLVAAVSSIVFLLPTSWVSVSDGQTSLLGVDMTTWSWLHKWSGLAMVGGVVLHTLLHTRWIVNMTRRVFGRPAKERRPAAAAGGPDAANVSAAHARPIPAAPVMETAPADAAIAARHDGGMTVYQSFSPQPTASMVAGAAAHEDRRDDRPLYTRKAFLGAAATILAGATVVGLTMADRGSGVSVEENGTSSSTQSDQSSGTGSSGASSSDDSGSAQSETPAQSTQSVARVSVDEGSCTGCGHCLQVCPAGVFAFSGSTAIAASPDSCSLCGRCLQVCRPQAITLTS